MAWVGRADLKDMRVGTIPKDDPAAVVKGEARAQGKRPWAIAATRRDGG
jgi:hypothetical protein